MILLCREKDTGNERPKKVPLGGSPNMSEGTTVLGAEV